MTTQSIAAPKAVKSAARIRHEQRLSHRLILKQLATEAPVDQNESSSKPFVSNSDTLHILKQELGSVITKDQFDLLVEYSHRDLKSTLDNHGFICQKAIHQNSYAAFLEKILHILVQNVGLSIALKSLSLHQSDIWSAKQGQYSKAVNQQDDLAFSIITDIIAESSTQKGYKQSITQLVIARCYGIGQVINCIKNMVMSRVDAFQKAVKAGTQLSQFNRVTCVEDTYLSNLDGVDEPIPGHCPRSAHTPEAAINAISNATTELALKNAIASLSDECKSVLYAWVSDAGQQLLANNGPGPSADFKGLVVRLRPLTGLSIRHSKVIAPQIIEHFRSAFGMIAPERRSTKGWRQRETKTVLKRKVKNAVSPVIDQPWDWHHQGSFTSMPEPCTAYPHVITVPMQVHAEAFNEMINDLFNRTRNGNLALAKLLNTVD